MTVLDVVPGVPVDRVERITARAREVHFGRTVLTVLAAVLYGLGWVVWKAAAGAWFVLSWCAAAVKVGWDDARDAQRARAAETMKRAGDGVDA